ncbi:hypothetical protein M1437_01035 [Patescibacteria group bacterium]|nr:hypothetical protein [Patescibacteria group bacterium]
MRILKLNSFLKLVGFLFAAKVVFGVFYLVLGWQVSIAGWVMPMWLIIVAIVVDVFLAITAFKFIKK